MLKERLVLSKKLLAEGGVIFVSIDDHEQTYLKVLMDEIFGKDNFISNIVWKKKTKTNDAKFICNTTEYVLFYAKNKTFLKINQNYNISSVSYNLKDSFFKTRGGYKLAKLDNRSHTYSKKLDYEFIYQNKKYYPGGDYLLWVKRQNNIFANKDWQWMWSQKNLIQGIANDQIVFKNNSIYSKRYWKVDHKLVPITRSEPFTNLIIENIYLNFHGSKELINILQAKLFDHPKPISLLKNILGWFPNKNATILDFFAGSGTTGHAVLDLNRKDGGTRKFILVTNKENDIDQVCYERLHRIIKGVGTNGETDFLWKQHHQPYQSTLEIYHIDSVDIVPARQNFEFDFQNNPLIKKIIANYQILNPDYQPPEESTLLAQLLKLTYNANISN